MSKKTLLVLAWITLTGIMVSAQTVIPPGPVFGHWNLSGSPYFVEGEITVPAGETLFIDPGVQVIFEGHYKLYVYGYLEAVGVVGDSILFTAGDPGVGWHGIRFVTAADSSHLSYCIIQYGRAIGTGSGDPDAYGGGIACFFSSPVISHCSIKSNYAHYAGGIHCHYSNPTISHSNISGNSAEYFAGGICCYYSSPTISYCTISNDIAIGTYGGGIWLSYSDPTISACLISENIAGSDGGGIECVASSPTIINCTITGNLSGGFGGGIDLWNSPNPTIVNTIVEGNTGDGGIYFFNTPNPDITYSDFCNNQYGDFTGTPPPNLGVISGTNANGDPCDVFQNIFLDPIFVVPGSDFHLDDWSPCIGAGDPATLPGFDIEGNPAPNPPPSIIDIGAYEHERPVPLPVELTAFEAIAGDGLVRLIWRTESETDNDHFVLYKRVVGNEDFGALTQVPGSGTTSLPHDYEFIDRQVVNGITYEYQISDVDINGVETLHNTIVSATPTAETIIPTEYALYQNYPNPFNASTTIRYDITEPGSVSLKVYNLLGREVAILVDEKQDANSYTITWDATGLPSGIYFYQLRSGDFNAFKKLVLLK